MYFDKVFELFNEYDDAVTTAKTDLQKAKQQLPKIYGNGSIYEQKMKEAKELYKTSIENAKRRGIENVTKEFDSVEKKIRAFITAPLPQGFVSTLEAVKAAGKNITKAEAELYLDQYKNNYTAYKTLAACISDMTGGNYYYTRYDSIKNSFDECRRMSTDFFNTYLVNAMSAAFVMTKNSNNPLYLLDNKLEAFMNSSVGICFENPEYNE